MEPSSIILVDLTECVSIVSLDLAFLHATCSLLPIVKCHYGPLSWTSPSAETPNMISIEEISLNPSWMRELIRPHEQTPNHVYPQSWDPDDFSYGRHSSSRSDSTPCAASTAARCLSLPGKGNHGRDTVKLLKVRCLVKRTLSFQQDSVYNGQSCSLYPTLGFTMMGAGVFT